MWTKIPFVIVIVLALFAPTQTLNAQEQALSGTITDKNSGEALIGVHLALFTDTSLATRPIFIISFFFLLLPFFSNAILAQSRTATIIGGI